MSWTHRFPVGVRVHLCGDHPWSGYTGTVARHSSFLGRRAVVVELDCGGSAGITRPELLDLVTP